MAKAHDEKESEAESKHAKKDSPLTAEAVHKMIDAAFVRYDMTHGHLGASDGAELLKKLEG